MSVLDEAVQSVRDIQRRTGHMPRKIIAGYRAFTRLPPTLNFCERPVYSVRDYMRPTLPKMSDMRIMGIPVEPNFAIPEDHIYALPVER